MSLLQGMPRPTKTYHTKSYDRISKHHNFTGTGKTILITGGANGVGYHISKAFASANIARLAIISRSPGPQETTRAELSALYPSVEILTFTASITDTPRMSEILTSLGSIDVLILNAAVAHRRAPSIDITISEVQDAFNTNVVAPFALTQAYLSMPQPQKKTILNVSSAAALMPSGFRVGYGPSKAAFAQMMHHFAAEQKTDDVKIVSFHPGIIWTPGTERTLGNVFNKDSPHWEDIELPAHFALWLAGEESGFLHGRFVWAQWDVDELVEMKERFETKGGNLARIGLVLE